MMIFVQLLVFTCACALGTAAEVPSYENIVDDIMKAWAILDNNILSMDGNVPLLNDPRRHYAEIMHVVHYAAQLMNTQLVGPDYYRDYQRNIKISAPFGIANPQSVVDETNKVINDIINSVDKVLQLVKTSANNGNQDRDKAIDEEIKNNVGKNGWSLDVLIAVELVAKQLIEDHKKYFAATSQNLSAHSFVITGVSKLEKLAMALLNLYGLLYPPPPPSG